MGAALLDSARASRALFRSSVIPLNSSHVLATLTRSHFLSYLASVTGQNSPLPEQVVFSDFVIKINRKDKEQTRVILLTNKAVYNLLPSAYGKCKRRIALETIASITASSISDEFVLHVPEEYDYRSDFALETAWRWWDGRLRGRDGGCSTEGDRCRAQRTCGWKRGAVCTRRASGTIGE